MSALKYQLVFTESINQTTDITLAGQSDDAPVTADHKVIVEVPKADLDSLLTWTGAYSSGNVADGQAGPTFPEVTFNPATLFANASVMALAEEFNSVSVDALGPANGGQPTLQGQFKQISTGFIKSFAWVPADIPLEAVVTVVNNPMTGPKFTETIVSSAATRVRGSAPVDLYEQAVAADKTKSTGLDLVAGDSISLYITYTLAKKRIYHLDAADAAQTPAFEGAPVAKAMIGGVLVAEGDEENATVTRTYEFEFVVSA